MSTSYSEEKKRLLALAHERQGEGLRPADSRTPDLFRTLVSELRVEQGVQFVRFKVGDTESRYCLCDYAGGAEDQYSGLRLAHPEAKVGRDDRIAAQRRGSTSSGSQKSKRAQADRRRAKTDQSSHRAREKAGGDLEVYRRMRHRTSQSIENVISIPELLVSSKVPEDEAESLLEDLNDLAAYADTLIALIHGKVDDAAFAARIAKLRNVEGRSPEETRAFLAQAAKLERKRQQRLAS